MTERLGEVDRLRARVAELEDELAEYRRQEADGGLSDDAVLQAERLKALLRVRRGAVRMLALLMDRAGRVVSYSALRAVAALNPDEITSRLVHVYACALRDRLGAAAIETIWGIGYRLPVHVAQAIEVRLAAAGEVSLGVHPKRAGRPHD